MKIFIASNFGIQVMIFWWYEQKVSNPRRCSNLKRLSQLKKFHLVLCHFIREKTLINIFLFPTFAFLQKRILCSLSYINIPIWMSSMLRDFPYFLHTLSTFLFKASFFSSHTLNRLSPTVNDVLSDKVSFEYNFTSFNCSAQQLDIFGDLNTSFLIDLLWIR